MAWTLENMPGQRGRVAVVTGANGGLGLAAARGLVRAGATVVIAARNQEKAEAAVDTIRTDTPGADVTVHELDLASIDSVRKCADAIVHDHPRLDLLINNAGLMATPASFTPDGFEMQLGVNHLGHFVLTKRLLPALLRAPGARIVSVTSFARLMGRAVDPANPHLKGKYNPWRAYGQSKLANYLFGVELQRRLAAADAPVKSFVAHPGLTNSDLQARSVEVSGGGWSQRFWHLLARRAGMPPARGALCLLRAGTDPEAGDEGLYGPRWGVLGPPAPRRLIGRPSFGRAARSLWEVSERETKETFDVGALVRAAGSGNGTT